MTEGHFYLQYDKLGSMMRLSNYLKNEDFVVPRKFVMNQLRVNKMTISVALTEILACKDSVRSAYAELQFIARQINQVTLHSRVQDIDAVLQRNQRQFRPIPDAVKAWMAQYEQLDKGTPLFRFKTLVLQGPSQLVKTSWATSFYGSDVTLLVNCQRVLEPNLKDFSEDPSKYKCIIFDEANWELIYRNKMLFQACNKLIKLGETPTQQWTYVLHVYNVPMVICSNEFYVGATQEALEYLDKDRAFLTKGGVFTDSMIDAYIELKMQEVTRFRQAVHPVEYDMYYSL
jgi:hypothetical protein